MQTLKIYLVRRDLKFEIFTHETEDLHLINELIHLYLNECENREIILLYKIDLFNTETKENIWQIDNEIKTKIAI